MTKTTQELRKDWVAALRSGDYKQSVGALCKDGGYCCIGVAAKIIGISDDVLKDTDSGGSSNSYETVKKTFGMQQTLGVYDRGENALYLHNDSDKWNFNQIADLIESEPEGLFIND